VTVALPVPADEPSEFETVVTAYVVVVRGATDRVIGLEVTFTWVRPSDQTTVHGGVPLRSTRIWAGTPWQVVELPLTVAVGTPPVIGMLFDACSERQPATLVSMTVSVIVPEAAAEKTMELPVVPEVIVPFVMFHRYVLPALWRTLAMSPAWLGSAEPGPLIVGLTGLGFTATVTVGPFVDVQPLTSVTVSV
jgi:hypothetical protein